MAERTPANASAGHRLGQVIGDWYEEYFVLPLLEKVANHLQLYLDHRFRKRPARREKIVWADDENNDVDYDFVLELDGRDEQRGIPVAFLECFWRRGARHSKDKARDDSGKLMPMRNVHPTARFLGIIAGGDFTKPARQLVLSREIDLFYVPKAKIVQAFEAAGLVIDYPDKVQETYKQELADRCVTALTKKTCRKVAESLQKLVGESVLDAYVDRVRGALGALPQELRFLCRRNSDPRIFETIPDASAFLDSPQFDFSNPTEGYLYEITYSDGTEFQREVATLDQLRVLHLQIERLATHVATLQRQNK